MGVCKLDNSVGFVHSIHPVLFSIGSVQIRYYGVIFAITLIIAFLFWKWQMRRGGYAQKLADNFLLYGVAGTIIGARLGHCFFYDWHIYKKDPISILYFWRGGLASHGATIGIILAIYIYTKVYKLKYIEMLDRFTFSAAIGAAGVRLGNFMNSGIVGRETDLPWGVRFMYYDRGAVLRHPSQIYEFLMGLFVLSVLLLVDKKCGGENRPLGLLIGVFLSLYFLLRFFVEFFKEYQTDLVQEHTFTMGQYLSLVPFGIGVTLIVWSLMKRRFENKL